MTRDRLAFAGFRALAWRKGALALCVALCTLGLSSATRAQTITTFEAPGAGTGAGQGTQAFGITPSGMIVGFYLGAEQRVSRLPARSGRRLHHD